MPPNDIFFSARPPIQKSTVLRPVSTPCPCAGAVKEVEAVGRGSGATEDQQCGGGALVLRGVRVRDARMRAVGGDEVDDRCRVLQVQGEVGPAFIGLELRVAGWRRRTFRAPR